MHAPQAGAVWLVRPGGRGVQLITIFLSIRLGAGLVWLATGAGAGSNPRPSGLFCIFFCCFCLFSAIVIASLRYYDCEGRSCSGRGALQLSIAKQGQNDCEVRGRPLRLCSPRCFPSVSGDEMTRKLAFGRSNFPFWSSFLLIFPASAGLPPLSGTKMTRNRQAVASNIFFSSPAL